MHIFTTEVLVLLVKVTIEANSCIKIKLANNLDWKFTNCTGMEMKLKCYSVLDESCLTTMQI